MQTLSSKRIFQTLSHKIHDMLLCEDRKWCKICPTKTCFKFYTNWCAHLSLRKQYVASILQQTKTCAWLLRVTHNKTQEPQHQMNDSTKNPVARYTEMLPADFVIRLDSLTLSSLVSRAHLESHSVGPSGPLLHLLWNGSPSGPLLHLLCDGSPSGPLLHLLWNGSPYVSCALFYYYAS